MLKEIRMRKAAHRCSNAGARNRDRAHQEQHMKLEEDALHGSVGEEQQA